MVGRLAKQHPLPISSLCAKLKKAKWLHRLYLHINHSETGVRLCQKAKFQSQSQNSRDCGLNSHNSKTETVLRFDDVNELDLCAFVNWICDDYLPRSYSHVQILAVVMRRNGETVLLRLPPLPVVSPKWHLPRLRSDQSQAALTRHGRSRSQWQPFTILAGAPPVCSASCERLHWKCALGELNYKLVRIS